VIRALAVIGVILAFALAIWLNLGLGYYDDHWVEECGARCDIQLPTLPDEE
jgi:hypothetical protein